MPIPAGHHTFGPANADLTVRTGRTGAASRAGHDLVMEVTAWEAALDVGRNPPSAGLTLSADPTSLRVRSHSGGMQAFGDGERESVRRSIGDDVLKRGSIAFRSTSAQITGGGDRIGVQGDLELRGRSHPLTFELAIDEDGRLTGSAVVRQTDWGIKPYTALFGALKVADEVVVAVGASLRPIPPAEPPAGSGHQGFV